MAAVIGEAAVRIRGDTSTFKSDTEKGVLGGVGGVLKKAAGLAVGFGIFKAVKDDVIGFNSTLEQSRTAFTVLTGSAGRANDILAELQEFAKTTPFAFEDILGPSQQLLGALGKSTDVTAKMRELGDAISATGGSAAKLDQLTLAYTQLATSGTARLGDLNQINNAVPGALTKMAESAGLSMGEFREKVSQGAISSAEAVKLFHNVATDPKFGIAGGMEAQSATFAGAMSNIGDAIQQGLASAGKPIFEFVSTAAKGFAQFLAILQDTGSLGGSEMDQFFGQFGVAGQIMLTVLRGLVDAFGLFRQGLSLLGTGIGIVAGIIEDNWTTIQSVTETAIGIIRGVIAAVTDMVNFMIAHQDIFGPLAIGIGIAAGALLAVAAAFVIATTAATVFGAVMAVVFSPITIVVVTLGLLIGAVILAYQHFQTFRTIVQTSMSFIQTFVPAVLNAVRTVISTFVNVVTGFWNRFGSTITAVVRLAFNLIKIQIQTVMGVIRGIIQIVLGLIHGNWSQVWNGIKTVVGSILNGMVATIRALVGAFASAAKTVALALYNGMVNKVKELPGAILRLIQSIPGKLGDLGSLLLDAGKQIALGLLNGLKDGFNAVKDEVSGWGGKIADLKGPIEEDRKLLVRQGQAITEGLHRGLLDPFPALLSSVEQMAPMIQASLGVPANVNLGTAGTPVGGLSGPLPGQQVVIGAGAFAAGSIVIHAAPGQSPEEIARAVMDAAANRVLAEVER